MAAARRLLEDEGAEALTMRRLADQVGIKAPSLYKHLPDKTALEAAIIATGLEEAATVFEAAVAGGRPVMGRVRRGPRSPVRTGSSRWRTRTCTG